MKYFSKIARKIAELFSCYHIPFFLLMPLTLWAFLIHHLQKITSSPDGPFTLDALVYYRHLKEFLGIIRQGIFPLWSWQFGGMPNEFFLRRFGEFNPFHYAILLFQTAGLNFTTAYSLYLLLYFGLGMLGFYLLAKRIYRDASMAFAAYLLLLASSLGTKLLDSYIFLLFVPGVWFFYFLIAFAQEPKKVFFLGLTFTVMITCTTYFPFYFLTIFWSFLLFYFVLYFRDFCAFLKSLWIFFTKYPFFSFTCLCLIILSLIPGGLWYRETGTGNIVLPFRNTASPMTNAMAVSQIMVSSGGIIPPLIFDRLFSHLEHFTPDIFFIPVFSFLVLLLGIFVRVNKRLVLFLSWGFWLWLIGITDLAPLHKFLYQHIFYFKLIRNLSYLLWLGMLPIFILFVVEQFRLLLAYAPATKQQKYLSLGLALAFHGLFLFFLLLQKNVIGTTYVSVALSFLFFASRALGWRDNKSGVFFFALFVLIAVQPLQAYYYFARNYANFTDASLSLTRAPMSLQAQRAPYVALAWTDRLMENAQSDILTNYLKGKFYIYDHVFANNAENWNFAVLEQIFARNEDKVFVRPDHSFPAVVMNKTSNLRQALIFAESDKNFTILKNNVNETKLWTNFSTPKFLVYTDSFHPQWQALINNRPVDVWMAQGAFKGIWLPAGENTIYLRFGSAGTYAFKIFLLAVFMFTLGWLLLLAGDYFRKKKTQG